MAPLFLVMLGGALGAGARHLVGRATLAAWSAALPYGTLTVNLVGGVLMGVLAGAMLRVGAAGEAWRLFLGVGVIGGFTTFSAFSLDIVTMLDRGEAAVALGYALASVAGSVAALYAGLALTRAAWGAPA